MAEAPHKYSPYPNPNRTGCVRCGFPRSHPVHQVEQECMTRPQDEGAFEVSAETVRKNLEANRQHRISREAMFMTIAETIALRSTCLRGQVGAVIVREGRIISMGYNGAPSGQPDCLTMGCEELKLYTVDDQEPELVSEEVDLGCQRGIHAETNAIIWAARVGIPVYDSTMYSTHSPCMTCARLLVAAGISKLYFRHDYRAARLDILDSGLCQVTKI